MSTALPRLMIAAPGSGHGKTTVATGLMAALRRRGLAVSGHKVGPDYIDPGYHALATGRLGRNLDPQLVGAERIVPLLLHGAHTPDPADLAVIEGVMGLFDGAIGSGGFASTAHVADLVRAPVVLVVDVSHASRTVAAVVHGLATFDPAVHVAGVILNKVGSPRHEQEVRNGLLAAGVPVFGALGRDDGISAPSRHLGLVPAAEQAGAAELIDRLAERLADRVDLDGLIELARSAPPLEGDEWRPQDDVTLVDGAPVVAVAGGRAFTFRYPETDELLRAAGCRVLTFDPLTDSALPHGTAAVYLGGGFPETYASGLSAKVPLRAALANAVARGMPVLAECAGLLYLTQTLDNTPMAGALPATAQMTPRLTLAYRQAIADRETLVAPAGFRCAGHEFHRTTVAPEVGDEPAWLLSGRAEGFSLDPAGTGSPTVHASYLHTHWAGHPVMAQRFARAAAAFAKREAVVDDAHPRLDTAAAPVIEAGHTIGETHQDQGPDLHHHGDREVTSGLVDLAVNVSHLPRPTWLEEAIAATDTRTYPRVDQAHAALAARHVVPVEHVLATNGGAEAFTLVARARPWHRPVVVHPQFTEPEAALRAAGHDPRRAVLSADQDFRLDPAQIPEDADLVMVGNPTNPTGALHARASLLSLTRPGRVVVVDEAFMDAVEGERESLAEHTVPGLVVVRSLTKTWSIPGVRAGYVVGDPAVVRDLRTQQPPWSVSSLAAAALVACSSTAARQEASERARQVTADRAALVSGLRRAGLSVAEAGHGPFVLVRGPIGLREALRNKGFALRRGDTFPGLDASWLRISVRQQATTRQFLQVLEGQLDPAEGVR